MLACITLVPVMSSAENDSSQINRQREAIGRAPVEMQAGNWPSVPPYYTRAIEFHDLIVTVNRRDILSQFLAGLFGSTPD